MVSPHIQYLGPADPDAQSKMGSTTRELDSRTSDGIHVRLLWYPHDARVSVAVHDTKTGDAFECQWQTQADALDAFHHPYAYAAAARPHDRARSRAVASHSRPTDRRRSRESQLMIDTRSSRSCRDEVRTYRARAVDRERLMALMSEFPQSTAGARDAR